MPGIAKIQYLVVFHKTFQNNGSAVNNSTKLLMPINLGLLIRSQSVKLNTNEAPTGIRENNRNPIKFGAINASPTSKFLPSRETDGFFKLHYLTLLFSKAIAAVIPGLQQ